ncbi:helix-turn-helix domain-containing protein [Streptomyces zaomyceticus]|uniref:helix-turn-helix domain-containing protein n=1 Tax=Streptomyces zaomyceticus TaxID=68286 RepID=UPI00371C598F
MSDHVQSVRNAWINRVRDEALRARRPEVSKAVHIGILIATYANADGSRSYPSNETLAAIAGVSEETVTRCVRLLLAAELLVRRRRPNQSSVYQLLIPQARIDWAEHLHVWGETRQAKARKKAKAAEIEALLAERANPSGDGFPEPVPGGVPEPVPGGAPDTPGTRPRTGADTVPGRVPEPVPGGGLPVPPTSGRDPQPDQTMAALPPQPQAAREEAAESSPEELQGRPGPRLVPPPRGGCSTALSGSQGAGSQRPLLLSVRGLAADRQELSQEQRDEVRAQATPDAVRAVIAAEGAAQAVALYGRWAVAAAMNDTQTGT